MIVHLLFTCVCGGGGAMWWKDYALVCTATCLHDGSLNDNGRNWALVQSVPSSNNITLMHREYCMIARGHCRVGRGRVQQRVRPGPLASRPPSCARSLPPPSRGAEAAAATRGPPVWGRATWIQTPPLAAVLAKPPWAVVHAGVSLGLHCGMGRESKGGGASLSLGKCS